MIEAIVCNYSHYANVIKDQLNLKESEWVFKSIPQYQEILEHVDKSTGDRYLNEIKVRYMNLFNDNKKLLATLCSENDQFGNPKKENFDDFVSCSPTNIRYILHSFLVLEYIKKLNLNNLNVIEIGGGYGGLCFFIHKLSRLFNLNIISYSIFDIMEASKLQEKYLANLNINNSYFYQLDNFVNIKKDSFLISNYAFSEISLDLQKKYSEKIIKPYTSNGILCWNHNPVYQFTDKKIYIDKAFRVDNNKIFSNEYNLNNFEICDKNNWIEECLVTY
jgi:hypothetical protein